MDAEGLKELFAPFAPVSVKRMFSGHGVYADGICFALNLRGDIFLRVDKLTEAHFQAAGSEPFVYGGHRGNVTVMSYWRLVSSAYDDADELKAWCGIAMEAARRAAAVKQAKRAKRLVKTDKPASRPKTKSTKNAAARPRRPGRAKGTSGRAR
jgi:DNA transformation protein and related proteins